MNKSSLLFGYICLATVSILWGTTYFALRIGVETIPPYLFSGVRQLLSGILLILILLLFGKMQRIHIKDVWTQSIPGVLMIAFGNGIIGWSERYIPSGLAAMIVSILPVYVVLINYIIGLEKVRPNYKVIIGLLLGCVGIVLIFRDNLKDIFNTEYLVGMLMCFGACLSWAIGSIFAKHKSHTKTNPLFNASLQMTSGGIALLFMSLFLDDYNELQSIEIESVYALIYLIIFGSLIAYSAFVYSLQILPVEIASLYAYFNPFIAILLGYYLLDEPLSWMTFAALVFVLSGVYFINKGAYRKQIK